MSLPTIMTEAKPGDAAALVLSPARDGGYVVHTWPGPDRVAFLMLAGSLRECLEYMAKHFGADNKVSNLRPVS